MLQSSKFRSVTFGGFLGLALGVYLMSNPNEGMLSGPGTFSALLQSFPIVSF